MPHKTPLSGPGSSTAARRTRRGFLTAAAAACALAGDPAFAADDVVEPAMRLKARSLTAPPTMALTFDACPGGFDLRIAQALVHHAMPATVFVTGAWIRRHPEGVDFLQAHRELFAIENHGDRHVPPVLGARRIFGIRTAGDMAVIRQEVLSGAEDVRRLTGVEPRWYRASTGFYSRAAVRSIEGWGYGIGGYSLNADQGASLPARTVAHRIANAVDGDVIVAHINQPARASGAGVVDGLAALSARGVRLVRLDHLGRADVYYDGGLA